jgi:hypothetical protein
VTGAIIAAGLSVAGTFLLIGAWNRWFSRPN